MSSNDAKTKQTESKIMGAADAVSAVIDAVTTKSADAVREAAAKFNEDTKSDIRSLGDASGRTPLHLVRPKHRPCTSYSRGEEIHGTPTTSRPTAARSGFLLLMMCLQWGETSRGRQSAWIGMTPYRLIIWYALLTKQNN